MNRYQTLVVPYDFSDHSKVALNEALELARGLSATLHLVHVMWSPHLAYTVGSPGMVVSPPPLDTEELRKHAEESLQKVADDLKYDGPLHLHVREGISVSDAIRDAAEELKADLLVMGTHGRTGFAHVFLGSVAERVLRNAPCPVLTVKAKAKA